MNEFYIPKKIIKICKKRCVKVAGTIAIMFYIKSHEKILSIL